MSERKKKAASAQGILEFEHLPEGMIRSRNSLFVGDMIEKPKVARKLAVTADGIPQYERPELFECPYCFHWVNSDECDQIGAEQDCLFCPDCNNEFEMG